MFTGYVILNYGECHNCVAITNAHATSILTCDRIASHNSRRISKPYRSSKVHSFKEPIDSKRLKLTSTCHFLLKLDVRGSDSHKHSHFTKVGKSQQRIKVLVQGESTTWSSQMVGKAISELMH
jgi:hypothetical protein